MSEMAMVSSKKFKLESEDKKGKSGAKTALDLAENPTKFLSTIQIGITLIGILIGIFSGDSITEFFIKLYATIPFLESLSNELGAITVVVLVTYISIVLGELFPKKLGMNYPEKIAVVVSKPMNFLSKIMSPFVWLLSASNNILGRILGIDDRSDTSITEEEIKSIIKESAETGEIDNIEQDIVERVFELGDRKVSSLLTYKADLTYLNIEDDWQLVMEKIKENKHSAYPVIANKNIDEVVGVAFLKDLFEPILEDKFTLKDVIREPIFINEHISAYHTLELFKQEKVHYGIVVDEYGATQGVVSMDDLLDALVGESTEIDQDEYQIIQRNDKSWLVDGQFSIFDFCKYFNLTIDDEALSEYSTVAGFMIHLKGDLLQTGESINYDFLNLEVIDKDGQRIDKIMVSLIEEDDSYFETED